MSKAFKLKLGVQKFQIGDEVTIDLKKKNFYGKSVRRRIIDSIMEEWRNNSLQNLGTEVERNFIYKFDSTKKTLKVYSDILNRKRSCESTIFKRHDEAKMWFKNMVEVLDNIEGAIVVGVMANYGHLSKICPSNVCYVEGKPFYKYNIMLHGLCDEKQNHVQFEIELFDEDMKLLK